MITILIGKSASGKDTIMQDMIKNYGFKPIISTTTRPMREGEKDGREYNFTSKDEFLKDVENGKFLEYREYNAINDKGETETWYYGSPIVSPKSDQYIVILDVKGALDYVDKYGEDNVNVIEVSCPEHIREERARSRGSFNEEEWKRRAKSDNKIFSEDNSDYVKLQHRGIKRFRRLNSLYKESSQTEYISIYSDVGNDNFNTREWACEAVIFEVKCRLLMNSIIRAEDTRAINITTPKEIVEGMLEFRDTITDDDCKFELAYNIAVAIDISEYNDFFGTEMDEKFYQFEIGDNINNFEDEVELFSSVIERLNFRIGDIDYSINEDLIEEVKEEKRERDSERFYDGF